MSDALGLSIGTFNLVAVRANHPPLARRPVLTLVSGQTPRLGGAGEGGDAGAPTGSGPVLRGFVERVGDPTPLIAADGSAHHAAELLAAALDALAGLAGGGSPVSIAYPAHWAAGPLEALRSAVHTRSGLAPAGAPPALVTDTAAAVAVLRGEPGLPRAGAVALCDLGASGTSITLIDVAADYAPIGGTMRYGGFSGSGIDQAILDHLLARTDDAADPAGTTAAESLARLRDECRAAKEHLSAQPTVAVPAGLRGPGGAATLTRGELEHLISPSLDGVLDAVANTLARNMIPPSGLAAVAVLGGGAAIPVVRTRLSERLQVPVITVSQPIFAAATGATLAAASAPATPEEQTRMAPATWAAGPAGTDTGESATFRALAWSQDASDAREPVPYSGADYSVETPDSGPLPTPPEPMAWYKRPVVLFGLAAALALAATGGLAYTLTGSRSPGGGTTGVTAPPAPAGPTTVTVTAPDGSTSVSTIPPSPSSTSDTPSASSTTGATSSPSTTSTTSTTSTSPASSSTETTSTATPTTTASTQPTPATTAATTPPTQPTQPTSQAATEPASSAASAPTTHSEPTGGQ